MCIRDSLSYAIMEWLAGRYFDGIVAATPKIAERFPPAKTVVVQNYPVLEELSVKNPVAYAKRPPVITYVGGITRIRGIKEIVQAVGLLPDKMQAKLILAGRLDVYKRQVLFLSRIVTLVIGGILGSPRLALWLFSISGAFIYGWLTFWIMRKTGVAPLRLLAQLKEYLLCSGALLVPLLIITKIISGHPLLLLLTVALAGIIYLMFLFRRDPVLQGILLTVIGKAGS